MTRPFPLVGFVLVNQRIAPTSTITTDETRPTKIRNSQISAKYVEIIPTKSDSGLNTRRGNVFTAHVSPSNNIRPYQRHSWRGPCYGVGLLGGRASVSLQPFTEGPDVNAEVFVVVPSLQYTKASSLALLYGELVD